LNYLNEIRAILLAAKKPSISRSTFYLLAGMIIAVGFFIVFYNLAEDMLEGQLGLFDQHIIDIVTGIRTPLITEIMKLITALGSAPVLISLAVLAVCFLIVKRKNARDAVMLVIALGGASYLNWILKLDFHRSRPDPPSLVLATGYSFPSGHAMIAFVFYGMLVYLLLANFRRNMRAYLLAFSLALLVLAIGISRIYLGVHYPSDVMAGYAAGGIWLTACIMGLQTFRQVNGLN
jgi:membrane-associated phospholipid phosphatase